jgi:hypothetical protein
VRAERAAAGLSAPHAWVVANPLKANTAAAAAAEAAHLLRKVCTRAREPPEGLYRIGKWPVKRHLRTIRPQSREVKKLN